MLGAAALALVGAAGGWALRVMLAPAPDVLESPGYTLVTATSGTVEKSLRLNASAKWEAQSKVANQAAGVLTTIRADDGAPAGPGDVIYTVDLRPVVVGAGAVPAFRELGAGATGADVEQLQRLLAAKGFYSGRNDGVFSAGVGSAVKAWQRSLKIDATGTVRRGDVVFVPALPARLAMSEEATVGTTLTGGEAIIQVMADAPRFSITLTSLQAQLVNGGQAVEINGGKGTWAAQVSQVTQQDTGAGFVADLAAAGGSRICGEECATIPIRGSKLFPSVIRVVAPVSGICVPAVAVVTTSSGEVGVLMADGGFRPVKVVISADGTAVVEGLAQGEQVRASGGNPAESRP